MQKISNHNFNYLPLQPGFEINKDYYIQINRDSNDSNAVVFYQFQIDKNSNNSLLVVPDGCIDIIFRYNNQKISADCYGSLLQSKKVLFQSDYEYFGVRFLAEQGVFSMKDLIESEIPLLDLITSDPYIIEKIANSKSFVERINFINNFIKNSVPKFSIVPELVKYSIDRIYKSKGNINLDQLSAETGYSIRYIRKKFEEVIGIPPKFFSEIVRFQNSLSMIIKNDEFSLWDIINENGYYDQAHFINQFKKFSTLTPTKFMETFGNTGVGLGQKFKNVFI